MLGSGGPFTTTGHESVPVTIRLMCFSVSN
jgi:hypothetical protein